MGYTKWEYWSCTKLPTVSSAFNLHSSVHSCANICSWMVSIGCQLVLRWVKNRNKNSFMCYIYSVLIIILVYWSLISRQTVDWKLWNLRPKSVTRYRCLYFCICNIQKLILSLNTWCCIRLFTVVYQIISAPILM